MYQCIRQTTGKLFLDFEFTTEQDQYLSVDPEVHDRIVSAIKAAADKVMAQNVQPILLSTVTLRRHIKAMVDAVIPSLMVLSESELLKEWRFKSVGEVKFPHAS